VLTFFDISLFVCGYSRGNGSNFCRPTFLYPASQPLQCRDLIHRTESTFYSDLDSDADGIEIYALEFADDGTFKFFVSGGEDLRLLLWPIADAFEVNGSRNPFQLKLILRARSVVWSRVPTTGVSLVVSLATKISVVNNDK